LLLSDQGNNNKIQLDEKQVANGEDFKTWIEVHETKNKYVWNNVLNISQGCQVTPEGTQKEIMSYFADFNAKKDNITVNVTDDPGLTFNTTDSDATRILTQTTK
jgi:hypothetical protein